MKKNILVIIILLTICQSVFSQQMLVQQDTILSTIQNLEEVTVTSSKELHKLKAIPASVSLISSNKIEQNKIESLKDLSSFIPNLFMPDYGSKLTSPIYIRGIGSKIGSPSVGLYVNGVPYFEKACFDFNFSEIASIEVLRGPQGTLYGRNTMGGIINIHTKSPENYTGNSIYIGYGEYNNKTIGASTYNHINNKLSYSLSANYNKRDGFFKNEFNNEKVDDMESYDIASKLVYKASENFKSSLNFNYQGSKQGGYPYGVYNPKTKEIAPINYNRYSSYDRDIFSASLYNEYKSKNILFSSSTSYNYFDDTQAIDQDFSAKDYYFIDYTQKQNMLSQEFIAKSNNDGVYKWVLGAFGFHQKVKANTKVTNQEDLLKIKHLEDYSYMKANDITTAGAAIFHQSTLSLNKFSISGGIRVDYEYSSLEYKHNETTNSKTVNVKKLDDNLEFFEVLPKASIKYNVSTNNFIYATVAKGYKSGGFNSSFERDKHISYDPEQSWNYEVGIKTNLLNNKVFINLTAFFIDWKNQQIAQTVPSGRGRVQVNAGESESKGIELESRFIIVNNLELFANYGYTNAKFVKYTDIVNAKDENGKPIMNAEGAPVKETIDYSGNYIPYIPKQTISLGINYKYELESKIVDAIKFNSTYKGFGDHYWNSENSVKQSYYYTIDAKVSFVKNNFTFDIWGKNLNSADYIAYHFSMGSTSFAQNGKPSQIGASLKYTF